MKILDLGCGPAKILESLLEDIEYVGADISQEYIDAARKKYPGRGTFHCLRVKEMTKSQLTGFDLVMGIGVLHHLSDDEAMKFFFMASDSLASGGRCLTIDPCFVEGQNPLAKALILRDRGRSVRNPSGYMELAKKQFSLVDRTIRHDMLRIPSPIVSWSAGDNRIWVS